MIGAEAVLTEDSLLSRFRELGFESGRHSLGDFQLVVGMPDGAHEARVFGLEMAVGGERTVTVVGVESRADGSRVAKLAYAVSETEAKIVEFDEHGRPTYNYEYRHVGTGAVARLSRLDLEVAFDALTPAGALEALSLLAERLREW